MHPQPRREKSGQQVFTGQSNLKHSNGFQSGSARPMMFRSHGYLDNHLKLTDEQKAQLREVRKAGHDRVREFGKPFRERIIAEDQTRAGRNPRPPHP